MKTLPPNLQLNSNDFHSGTIICKVSPSLSGVFTFLLATYTSYILFGVHKGEKCQKSTQHNTGLMQQI